MLRKSPCSFAAGVTKCTHLIIGGGTAGCVLANRLSADPDNKVVLLEAGGSDRHPVVKVPAGYLYCIGNPTTDWMFTTEADKGLGGRSLKYPRGKLLGGCSSINGMLYLRGQARDYDQWAALTKDPSWSWANCLPRFKRHESHWRHRHGGAGKGGDEWKEADLHGSDGELPVVEQKMRWPVLTTVRTAVVEAGIPETRDFNTGTNEGVGFFEVNQRNGQRWSASASFLSPEVRQRPNLAVVTNATARKLLFAEQCDDQGQPVCRGASVDLPSGPHDFIVEREVVLSAGSLGSTTLLQLSGIGPADLLARYGVPPEA